MWTAAKDSRGYGRVMDRLPDESTRVVSAHRVSWEFANERKVPEGLSVCHTCDTPACVRPDHLFVGTMKENMEDCARKMRSTLGVRNASSRFSERDVLDIYFLSSRGHTGSAIARFIGVHDPTVYDIISGRGWRHMKHISSIIDMFAGH